jgi:N-acetylmuramoyl-L-alanine amidase
MTIERTRTDYIVIHCSATPPNMDIGREEITQWHINPKQDRVNKDLWTYKGRKYTTDKLPPEAKGKKGNGWSDIGYHFVIRRSGGVERGRWVRVAGAHVKGYNSMSVGVCMVGGVDNDMKPEDNFTDEQWHALIDVISALKGDFPNAKIVGHRDLDSGKACPSFDVTEWVKSVKIN